MGDCLDKVLFEEERNLLSGPVPDKPKYYSSYLDEYYYDSGDEIRFKGKSKIVWFFIPREIKKG